MDKSTIIKICLGLALLIVILSLTNTMKERFQNVTIGDSILGIFLNQTDQVWEGPQYESTDNEGCTDPTNPLPPYGYDGCAPGAIVDFGLAVKAQDDLEKEFRENSANLLVAGQTLYPGYYTADAGLAPIETSTPAPAQTPTPSPAPTPTPSPAQTPAPTPSNADQVPPPAPGEKSLENPEPMVTNKAYIRGLF